MTDLEITRLCAEAMGRTEDSLTITAFATDHNVSWSPTYDPIHDDAQAMALVKKFELSICSPSPSSETWQAMKVWTINTSTPSSVRVDLNRAICECVAKMQAAKGEK